MAITHRSTSGSYSAQFKQAGGSVLNLGYTEEGYFLDDTLKGEAVRFEEFGDADIDFINRGHQMYLDVILKEWDAAAMAKLIWPFSSTVGAEDCIGQFATGGSSPIAGQLLLYPRACSPAGTTTDNPTWADVNILFHSVTPAEEVAKRINLNNKLRVIPLRFKIFLTDQSGDLQYYTFSSTTLS